jgi:hypothetical protein
MWMMLAKGVDETGPMEEAIRIACATYNIGGAQVARNSIYVRAQRVDAVIGTGSIEVAVVGELMRIGV